MREYKWRYPVAALLSTIVIILLVNVILRAVTKQTAFMFDWATLGMSMLTVAIARDIWIVYSPDKEGIYIIFTNLRDTLVVVLGLFIMSGIGHILTEALPQDLFVTLLSYALALMTALAIFYFGGSDELKANAFLKIGKKP